MKKFTTQERIVIACLSHHELPMREITIAQECDLLDYPYQQLFKLMQRKDILICKKNITTNALNYALNPAFQDKKEYLNKEKSEVVK